MAIVAFKTYSTDTACLNITEYLADGHGLAEVDRVNRYISDEHGLTQMVGSHRCPADPKLATAYMETLRRNYERQHSVGPNRKKKSTTHLQLVISPTREDNVPAEERMVMAQELIERTILRDFASLYAPHDNRPDKHIHVSICPFSIPDEEGHTYKLGMNNALLYDLRREMDRICVAHGYSIVDAPELQADPAYRDWFLRVREAGTVKVHQPTELPEIEFCNPRRRTERYAASKQEQTRKEEAQKAFYRKMTQGYSPETAEYYYTPAHLYDPRKPEESLHIKRYEKDGRELSELEQETIGMFVWAYVGKRNLASRRIPGSQGLQARLGKLADRATEARQLVHRLDIRTQGELIMQIKECGSDIAELKQEIARQTTILSRMTDTLAAINAWEEQDEDALHWLQEHDCGSAAEQERVKKACHRAESRKTSAERLLNERRKEYRALKDTEALLRPSNSREEWEGYLKLLMDKEQRKRVGRIREESLIRQIRSTGRAIGVDPVLLEQVLEEVKQAAREMPLQEGVLFTEALYRDSYERVSAIYDRLRERCQDLRTLRTLTDDLVVVGPFTFLLALAVCVFAGMAEAAMEIEIEELRQEAIAQKEYEKEVRATRQQDLLAAKKLYAVEVMLVSDEELAASRLRYLRRAAEILDRYDIVAEIEEGRQAGRLDEVIGEAALRALQSEPTTGKKRSRER